MTRTPSRPERTGIGEFDESMLLCATDRGLRELVPESVSVERWWDAIRGSIDQTGDSIAVYRNDDIRRRFLISVIGRLTGQDGEKRHIFTIRDVTIGDSDERLGAESSPLALFRDTSMSTSEIVDDAVDDYLVETSYRLRTPLAAIVGYSEILLEEPDPDDEVQSLAAQIREASESLMEVITALEDQIARERARRRVSELVRSLSTLISSTLDFGEVLQVIHSCVEEILDFDRSNILLHQQDGEFAVVSTRPDGLADGGESFDELDEEDPRFRHLDRSHRPLLVGDTERDPRLGDVDTGPYRSWLGVPLVWADELVGIITLETLEPDAYDAFDLDLLNSLGPHAGLAIANAREYSHARHLADIDGLTGAHTRRHFMEVAEQHLRKAREDGSSVSVLLMDLDHFKDVNDYHGHAAGDLVLNELVARCQANLRDTDVVGRYGGEEFLILLPGLDETRATRVAQRLCDAVGKQPFRYRDSMIHVTTSIGVCEAGEESDASSVVRRADLALYRAKRRGRNRVET